MRVLLTALALCAGTPLQAASWDGFLTAAFGSAAVESGAVCYARAYDARHLAAHKGQRLRDVAIRFALRKENGARRLDWSMSTHFVGSGQLFWSNGECHAFAGLRAHCYVEGDGGAFDVVLGSGGRTATARFAGVRIWRPQDAADESDRTVDASPQDRIVRLDRAANSMCRDAGD